MKIKKINKAKELFYRLSVQEDFQQDIREARNELRVPVGKDEKQIREWLKGKDQAYYKKRDSICAVIAEKYHLPSSFALSVDEYIFGFWDYSFTNNLTETTHSIKGRVPQITVSIFPFISKAEVLDAVATAYDSIKQKTPKERIRGSQNKKRDSRIFELSRLSARQLQQQFGLTAAQTKYKDIAIRIILKKEEFRDITEGSIRKIISRQRALRRVTHKGGL